MAVRVLRVEPPSYLLLYKKEAKLGNGLNLIGQVSIERQVTGETACGIPPGEAPTGNLQRGFGRYGRGRPSWTTVQQ